MTQEVQPLTWQKRTNIEEHQQFFAKINEIVGQLSGTVERSETALEEANTALTNARTAIATANAASAQAVEAATTVAGYNTRLTAVEVQAATNKSDINQLDAETQNLYDRDAQSVKLAADHIQVITGGLDLRGTNRTPNTAIGTDDTQMANGHRVIQELASYAPMVRTTGNQTIAGRKVLNSTFNGLIREDIDLLNNPSTASQNIHVYDKNFKEAFYFDFNLPKTGDGPSFYIGSFSYLADGTRIRIVKREYLDIANNKFISRRWIYHDNVLLSVKDIESYDVVI